MNSPNGTMTLNHGDALLLQHLDLAGWSRLQDRHHRHTPDTLGQKLHHHSSLLVHVVGRVVDDRLRVHLGSRAGESLDHRRIVPRTGLRNNKGEHAQADVVVRNGVV